jgi:hypothetical protein
MSEEKDIKSTIKEPVKNLTTEVVSGIVSRITRAGTRQTIDELKKQLRKTSAAKLQKQLETISERKIDKLVRENTERITQEMTQKGTSKEQIIRDIEEVFRQRLKKHLMKMVKTPVLKILIISTIIIIVIGIPVAAATLRTDSGDTTPPKIGIFISPEISRPNERVKFIVEAKDEDGIGWIELRVNGELVAEDDISPLVFTGGPYEEGTRVAYSASAYDEAGNRAWSGERFFQIPFISRALPDLLILEVWHEWINMDAGICVIKYSIQNRGEGEARPSLTVLRSGDEVIGEDIAIALGSGETIEREFPPVELSPKGFKVSLCSDFDNLVKEINENNNCFDYGI